MHEEEEEEVKSQIYLLLLRLFSSLLLQNVLVVPSISSHHHHHNTIVCCVVLCCGIFFWLGINLFPSPCVPPFFAPLVSLLCFITKVGFYPFPKQTNEHQRIINEKHSSSVAQTCFALSPWAERRMYSTYRSDTEKKKKS